MRATWYVLEDGRAVDPNEVAPNNSGVLTHKSGGAVAYGDHGNPRSKGVDLDEHGKLLKAPASKKEPEPTEPPAKEVKPEEGKASYKTRDQKAK